MLSFKMPVQFFLPFHEFPTLLGIFAAMIWTIEYFVEAYSMHFSAMAFKIFLVLESLIARFFIALEWPVVFLVMGATRESVQ